MNARKSNKFQSKQDGYRAAKRAHLCTACLYQQPEIWRGPCPKCGAAQAMRQYFMSKVELNRGAELIRLQVAGEISRLRFQPSYNLIVEGTKVGQYRADFEYFEDGKTVVEDTKPLKYMDNEAKLKIALFNALYKKHGLEVLISRRS